MRALSVLLLVAALSGCGGGDAGGGGAATTTTAAGTTRCTNERDGYSLAYPADWHSNAGDVVEECSFFHPEPFELRPGTEATEVAIRVDREPVPFDRVTGPSPARDVQSNERVEVAGRPAVRVEFVSTGEALLPQGVRGYDYLVDLDGETLVLSTLEVGELDFDAAKRVLDDVAASVELE